MLIVEDMFLIALELADQLADSGCDVIGPAASVKEALASIDGVALDGAVLDVNLAGERSFPIAEHLSARGIPFLFLTGYDSVAAFPAEFQQVTRLSKPVDLKALVNAVAAFGRRT